MSKLISLLFAGAGTATVSVGGFYLVRGRGSNTASDGDGSTPENVQQPIVKNLEEFKQSQEDACSDSLFGKIDFSKGLPGAQLNTNKLSDNSFFGTQSQDENKNKSCLTISFQKKKENNTNKWSGIFAWSWSFVNDKKGFMTFNVAKTVANNKLNLIGGIYLLEQEGSPLQWKIKHYREIDGTDKREISTSNFSEHFPKAKSGSSVFRIDSKDYWDFIENGAGLNDICEGGDCKVNLSPTSISRKWLWKWSNSGNNKVGEWSENLKWFEHIYGKENFNLEENIKDFSGKWESPTEIGQ